MVCERDSQPSERVTDIVPFEQLPEVARNDTALRAAGVAGMQ